MDIRSAEDIVILACCKPFILESYNFNLQSNNVYETLLTKSGMGFLSMAVLLNEDNNNKISIKITVDGVVFIWTNSNQKSKATGFLKESFLYAIRTDLITNTWNVGFRGIQDKNVVNTTIQPIAFSGVTYPDLPSTSEKNNVCHITSCDVYFESSLLIEAAISNVNDKISYRFIGGGC